LAAISRTCAWLCANLDTSERTIEAWVKEGWLPPPRLIKGKRLWKWADVEAYLEGRAGPSLVSGDELERIRNAAKTITSEVA
jgi:hypothetical protein